jgi:caspase domain protein
MKQKALVIGIDDYLGSPLHCCMNDAEEIARLLKTNSDGSKILMYFKKEYTRERRFGKDD